MRYIAFDLETTGLDHENDRIVEFCFIELDDQLVEKARWTELINPMIPIPAETVAIHGIKDEMVAEKSPFSHHAARIQRLVAGQEGKEPAMLIGQNVLFDVRFLHYELQRAKLPGLRVDHPTIDTAQLESVINPRNLAALYKKYTGNQLDDAHRSEADTSATVDVLRAQLRDHGGKEIPMDLTELEANTLRRKGNPKQAKTWLDHGHRFYEDAEGITRFGFGKYKDKPASSELDYLQWMLRQNFPPEVQAVCNEILFAEART